VLDDVSCYLKPFLQIKHIDGTGKEGLINCTCGYTYAKCLVSQLKTLKCLKYGPFLLLDVCLGVESKKKRGKLTEDLCDWEKLFQPKASVIG
jgi:hypothetical protein